MAHEGKTVKVHYKGTLSDGRVFDSSQDRDPIEFVMGEGKVIPGFENTVSDMEVGETRTVTIPSDDAYGEHNPEQVVTVAHDQFPDEIDPEEGMMLKVQTPQGDMPVRVKKVEEDGVTLDANHPLAGEDLTFELTLVETA